MSARFGAMLALDALRRPTALVLSLLGLVTVAIMGLVEHGREPAYAADRTLLGIAFGVVVPLLCYAVFEAVHRRERTSALTAPLARHGQSRRGLVLGVLVVLGVVCAGAGALVGAVAVLSARGVGDSVLFADVSASGWSGAAIGAAYAGLYGIGSLFGRKGRLTALGLDWLLGGGAGFLALPFPRSSARSLLGGEPVLGVAQLTALLVLLGLSFAGPFLAALREPR